MLERFSSLTDRELAGMDETLRGFNGPDMPENFQRNLQLPQGYVFIGVPPEKTIGGLKAVRDQLNSPARDVFAGIFREKVLYNVEGKAQNLARAAPGQFGNLWEVAVGRESCAVDAGFTPLQAFLFAYSLVSNDALDYSQANLSRKMKTKRDSRTESLGRPYPSPDGHRAYGVNGYLFSSPLDLFFDEQTVNRLLDRIEKGGGA